MKKVIFLATFIVSVMFASCGGSGTGGGSSAPSPAAFNKTAMGTFEASQKAYDAFDPKITAGIKSKDYASITAAADVALTAVNAQIEKLQATTAPEHGEEYKEAVLKALDMLKAVVETGKKYGDLKEGYSKKEFSDLEKEYNAKRKAVSAQLKEVSKASNNFSKATEK